MIVAVYQAIVVAYHAVVERLRRVGRGRDDSKALIKSYVDDIEATIKHTHVCIERGYGADVVRCMKYTYRKINEATCLARRIPPGTERDDIIASIDKLDGIMTQVITGLVDGSACSARVRATRGARHVDI